MLKNFTKPVRSAFAFTIAVCALAACAQNPNGMGFAGYGTVTGRVVDTQSLQPIPGATITVGNIVSVTAEIDQGGFVLRNVPAGTATLAIYATGWKTYKTQITVTKDGATDIGTIGLPSSLAR